MTRSHSDPEYIRNARIVRKVTNARLARGEQVTCVNRGDLIHPGQRFDVGHIRGIAAGGDHSLSNLGAAHRRCNRGDGGRAGAAARFVSSRRARRLPTSW